jgi:DNA-binding LacI/PurR family transcriptional regulator
MSCVAPITAAKLSHDSGRVTMRTVARSAGVSVQAVSLALRNQPSIAPETRSRIQALARELGYIPDPALTKLMYHLRSQHPVKDGASVCFLTTRTPDTQDHFCELLVEGAIRGAQQAGFSHHVAFLDADNLAADRFRRMLRARRVDGLLLLPMADLRPLDHLVPWQDFAVVAATRSVTSPQFDQVVADHCRNIFTLAERLQAAGFRRPGLVIDAAHDQRCGYLLTAGLAWHGAYGKLSPTRPHIFEQFDRGRFQQWLTQEQPDVLLAALEPIAAALKQDTVLAGQLPIICCSARPAANGEYMHPGIDDNPREIGAVAVELLARKIATGQRGIPERPHTTLIRGDWVAGPRENLGLGPGTEERGR